MDHNLDLSRVTYDLEEEDVTVIALINEPELRMDGVNLRLIKGQESEIPMWMAEILEDSGYVELADSDVVSPRYLRQIAHKETENRGLATLNSLLYRRVRVEIEQLRKKNTNSTMRRLASIEGTFATVLRLRNKKILNLATGGPVETDMKEILTTEEYWLYEHLTDLIKVYDTNVGMESQEMRE